MRRKRVFKRDWDDAILKKYYEAPFPFDIPGYKFNRAKSKMAVTQATPFSVRVLMGSLSILRDFPTFCLKT